jgi:hypothetical protein
VAATAALALAAGLAVSAGPAFAADSRTAQSAAAAPLTNLAHLDFLLDSVSPAAIDGHDTYRLAEEPELTVPWTYADARDGGTFERVGGGPKDPATGYYGQGAFNTDDIARTAVVYLRHFEQTGSESSRTKAYELLRAVAYMQTTTGPNAGNVVLWMQPDGTLNPSPVPVELPDPSDSGDSYWLARAIWAFGEGYAAFEDEDPDFAAFLQDRLQLAVDAVDRQVLGDYGTFDVADGEKVPAWLIAGGADISSEAILGLAAYTDAAPRDREARSALKKLARGVALMGEGDETQWPYGAILPWGQSRSMWHAWSSQMPAALAAASEALDDRSLLKPALADSATFTPTLLTASGPDNAWYPTPIEQVQIAYGADSRLQSLLAVADVSHRSGFESLAAVEAAWYFGANRSGVPVYDPATGVTFDGVQADGTVNRNSGAESTIHGLLSMLALDAHPAVAKRAQSVSTVESRDGLRVVEGESADGGEIVTPASAWTGESQYSGGKYLSLNAGQSATLEVPTGASLEPVVFAPASGSVTSRWTSGGRSLGTLVSRAGAQGITEIAGELTPQFLGVARGTTVTVTATKGTLLLDAVIARPTVQRLTLTGSRGATDLLASASSHTQRVRVDGLARSYDANGRLVSTSRYLTVLRPGGFAIVQR